VSDNYTYALFAHAASGGFVAARYNTEIPQNQDNSGIRKHVEHPAFVVAREDKSGWMFEPFHYVARHFVLHIGAFMGEAEMPKVMIPFYERYVEKREAALDDMPD